MRLSALKSLTTEECRRRLAAGQITRFQSMFRAYLNGEISWPQYCGPDVASLRERLNLTQEALAALLKVSPKTVFRWEAEAETIQPNYCIALCMLDKLGEGVFTLMDEHQKHFTLEAAPERRDNLTGDLADSVRYNLEANRRDAGFPDPFDGKAVAELRRRLGLTRRGLAEELSVSPSTVDKWEQGDVALRGPALTILKILWHQGLKALPPRS